jgi:hypothetical protein
MPNNSAQFPFRSEGPWTSSRRANCRARFTAADFAFIVRTVARSQTDQVSLVDLLSDVETRDSILDHPR